MTSLIESSLPCMTRTKSITSPRATARESRLSRPCRRRSDRDTSMPGWAASFTFPSKNTPRNIHLGYQRFAVDAESPLNSGVRRPVQNLSTDLSFRAHVAPPDDNFCVETQDSHPLYAFFKPWVVGSIPTALTIKRDTTISRF